jgi:hypothetical protein
MPFHIKSLVGARAFFLSTVLSTFVLTGCGKPSTPVTAEAAKPAGDPLQIQVESSMASRFKVADAAMSSIVPIQEVPGRI